MLRLLSLTLATLICVTSANTSAQADASGQFYEKDAASTVFGPDVVVVPKPRQEARKDDPKDKKSKIVSEFGNPAEDVPVLAMTTAPKPFQGMMKAMQEGESDLAYQYAKQYARYLRDFQDRTSRAAGLTQLGMVSEGTLRKEMVENSPLTEADMHHLEDDLKEKQNERQALVKDLTPAAIELLERAEAEESGKASLKTAPSVDQSSPAYAESERALARAALMNRPLPASSTGEVEVLFFFRSSDDQALRMIGIIEALGMLFQNDSRVKVVGKSLTPVNSASLADLRKRLGTSVPLEQGAALATELDIKESPSTVFLIKGSNQIVVEKGERSLYFIEEMLNQIRQGANG